MYLIYIIRKIIKTIFFSLKFFFNLKKNEALLVTLPRSGTHLTFGLLNICYSMKLGYQGKLGVVDDGYAAFAKLQMPLDERSIFYKYSFPHLWHSHLSFSKIVPLRKYFCKTLVLIREPVEGIKSFVLHALNAAGEKRYFTKEMNLKEFIELDKKYKFIEHYVSFLESWEKRKRKNSRNEIMILDHKYIKNNIHDYLNLVNNFFQFKFLKEHMQTAIAELDIKRISKASSSRSVRISKNKIKFSEEIDTFISKNCKKRYLAILKLAENEKITT